MKGEKPIKLYQLFLKHGVDPEFKRKFTQTILAMLAFFGAVALVVYLTGDYKNRGHGAATGEACDVFLARMREVLHHRMLTPAEEADMERCDVTAPRR
ncbi:MAG: hypothetical protein WAK67_08145 [Xanthobacteraceae bacterium]|jgi:hypothetical protein